MVRNPYYNPYSHANLTCLRPLYVRLTGLRKAPALTTDNWKELSPVGMWAALAHAFSVLALGAGAVSFGQIVKAGEPVFAAATNALLLKVSTTTTWECMYVHLYELVLKVRVLPHKSISYLMEKIEEKCSKNAFFFFSVGVYCIYVCMIRGLLTVCTCYGLIFCVFVCLPFVGH